MFSGRMSHKHKLCYISVYLETNEVFFFFFFFNRVNLNLSLQEALSRQLKEDRGMIVLADFLFSFEYSTTTHPTVPTARLAANKLLVNYHTTFV